MTKKKPIALAAKSVPALKPAAVKKAAPVVQGPSPSELQLKAYEHGVQLFSLRKLKEARAGFLEAAKGPAHHISDKARSYVQVCERRMNTVEVKLTSAEDHFNYGVERLNARDVDTAKRHLGRALAMEPDADHVLYTLALCCGMAGDGNGACENLKRAIDLEPRNRILARQDPEFSALLTQFPNLRALLSPEPVAAY
jgi:tetratricopeptide (TPR) repeat protein